MATAAPKKKILIVEDDMDIFEALQEAFESEGFQVVVASNGQTALDYLNHCEKLPNLVLLDLMMPVKDAFQFREEQRVTPRIANVPILLMSADSNLEAKKIQLGLEHSMKKPFELNVLLGKVRELCA